MPIQLLYGTTNPGKLASMRRRLWGLPLEIVGLQDAAETWPAVEENGASPLDNARLKALAYYEAFRRPVFSCDSSLYFAELPEAEQPGVHARRVAGRSLNDEEMLTHYAALAKAHGGRLTARYRNGICLVLRPDTVYEHMDDDIADTPFWLSDTPHVRRVPGFPLDALSQRIPDGAYYFDLPPQVIDGLAVGDGFRAFFTRVLPAEGQYEGGGL